jgi:hypothetical protein
MKLADTGFTYAQYLPDFLQIELFLIVKAKQELVPLGQLLNCCS